MAVSYFFIFQVLLYSLYDFWQPSLEKRENKVSASFFEVPYLHGTIPLTRPPHPEIDFHCIFGLGLTQKLMSFFLILPLQVFHSRLLTG
jgi:hypothetical protein